MSDTGGFLLLLAGLLLASVVALLLYHGHGIGEPQVPSVALGEYQIVTCEQSSPLPRDTLPISLYTLAELEELPRCKRVECRVVVGTAITRDGVYRVAETIIGDVTASDPDLDVVTLFLCSTEDRSSGAYDVARIHWSPDGASYNVDTEVAASNDRSGYVLTIDVRQDLESYLASISGAETLDGLNERTRRAIFRAETACEDAAYWEACKRFDSFCSRCKEFVASDRMRLFEYIDSYEASCVNRLLEKYRISPAALEAIMVEGLEKSWPMSTPIRPPACCE